MIFKQREDVIHEAGPLDRYLDDYLASEGLAFPEWVEGFGDGFYKRRNEIILELVTPLKPLRVLEFACAGPFLARLLVDNVPGIEQYTCSNFSPRMVSYCETALRGREQCAAALIDANVSRSPAMHRRSIGRYDLFVTTSLEHIEFDRELVRELPCGSRFVFSVALFDDVEHFRVFETPDDVRARYGSLLDIVDVRLNDEGSKLVASAVRNAASEASFPADDHEHVRAGDPERPVRSQSGG